MKEYKFKVSGKEYTVSVDNVEDNKVDVTVNGTKHKVELEKSPEVPVAVVRPTVTRQTEAATPATSSASAGKALKSPLPGVILDFFVKKGDTVKNGQKVVLLEAMKMENNIDADRDGTILEIKVAKGDSVNEGDTLLIIG
jgi:biotin carboxyl carrier protein